MLCHRFSSYPLCPCLGLFACAFQSWEEAFESGGCCLGMSWKELAFQETHPSFQPAALLQPSWVCRVQSSQAQHWCQTCGWPVKEIKDQAAINCFLHVFFEHFIKVLLVSINSCPLAPANSPLCITRKRGFCIIQPSSCASSLVPSSPARGTWQLQPDWELPSFKIKAQVCETTLWKQRHASDSRQHQQSVPLERNWRKDA